MIQRLVAQEAVAGSGGYASRVMEWIDAAIAWVSENESALSGIAALIVVAGVIFTPLGAGLRRLLSSRSAEPDLPQEAAPEEARAPRSGKSQATPTAPFSDRPSIAVLPFENLSNDDEQAFLADGMTEDIITGLSANQHLHVVSRNSTFAYKGRSPDIRDVGRELGVRYVIEGSVRRVGERMRTTAQLIESESGAHLWAEKYDRPYEKIFEVQDEVVAAIAGALNAQLSTAELRRARDAQPADLGAWELVQRALSGLIIDSPSSERYAELLALLRAAVERDPEYPYARAALAWMCFAAAINGVVEDPTASAAEGQRHLEHALEGGIDDPLTLFYAGAAFIYSGRHERGIQTLERSLTRNPNQPDVHMHLGIANGYLGRFEEAHAHFDRAEELGPTGGMSIAYGWYRAIVYGFEGRYEEAVEGVREYVLRAPRYGAARIELALDLAELGREEEARAAVERAVREDPVLNVEGLALLIGAHPHPDKGRERVARLRDYWPQKA